MKIIFVIPDLAGGGTEKVVSLLANEYSKRKIEVAILLFAGHRTAYELDPAVEVVKIAPASRGSLWIILKRMARMRKFFKQNAGCNIFAFSTMGAFFAAIAAKGIPHYFLVSERNDPRRSPHKIWFRWAYGRADKIIFQTPDVAGLFPARIVRKSAVIPNPIDSAVPDRFEGERKKKIVAVGRLEAQKNHALLLEAFAVIYRRHPDYKLHIYGVGPCAESLQSKAEELTIAQGVEWKGFTADVKHAIVDAKMYVLSSDYEGLSNSMMEAMAMGIPTIATDCPIGGARMMIRDGENGLLVPVGDREKLIAAMDRLIVDDELSEKISVNCERIRTEYSLAQIADLFLQS